MRKIEPITLGNFYHIYNRGNNGENLFHTNENYNYFLKLYKKHILKIAKTYAWCLLKNHFHFLVEVKSEEEINFSFPAESQKLINKPSQPFSNLFNAYVQAIIKQNNRHGSLLETPFKRKRIDDEKYLKNLILYIHNNPVQHNFVEKVEDYKWSSYNSIISNKESLIERERVIDFFDDKENFIFSHRQRIDTISIENSIL